MWHPHLIIPILTLLVATVSAWQPPHPLPHAAMWDLMQQKPPQQQQLHHQQLQRQQGFFAREVQSCEARQVPGPICESCELLATCVRQSNGWVNIPVESCDTENGFYCNSRLGVCSNETGPCHPFGMEGNFPCTSQGIFPDPYDCQKYHMCYFVDSSLISATVDCGGNKAFNAANGQCSLSVQDALCQSKQYVCQHAGDAHPWPSNPNIFYVCKATSSKDERVLYPSLYRCGDAEVFDGYYCRPITGGGGAMVTPPMPPVGQPTAATPGGGTGGGDGAATSVNPPVAGVCNRVGLYPDPADCHSYFYCSAMNGVERHMKCPDGTYYNALQSACALGTC